jgi:hypothetical protein
LWHGREMVLTYSHLRKRALRRVSWGSGRGVPPRRHMGVVYKIKSHERCWLLAEETVACDGSCALIPDLPCPNNFTGFKPQTMSSARSVPGIRTWTTRQGEGSTDREHATDATALKRRARTPDLFSGVSVEGISSCVQSRSPLCRAAGRLDASQGVFRERLSSTCSPGSA